MNENWNRLKQAIPCAPAWEIHWEILADTPLKPYILTMKQTKQNPLWHGEGDVWTHTKMVCEELVTEEEYRNLPQNQQQIVFLAALFHDIGKIPCTRWGDGAWVSPNHTLVGSKMARELLWKYFAVCGTKKLQNMRECICTLIRNHSVPVHILDQKDPERRLISIAAQGKLIPDFSLTLLKILVRADLKGRIYEDINGSLEMMELCFLSADELGVLKSAYKFPSSNTEHAYLSGKNVWREQDLYDDTWGEVILISGLPGTGKDTWLEQHHSGLPMVSLDQIRTELGILPTQPQGKVINEARQRAKEFLRNHQPFVWNATNTTSMIRRKQIQLFEQYHASVKIVFLETDWETEQTRNISRKNEIPQTAIEKMLKDLELPEMREAQRVEWLCV